jgi:hypothetical protein
MRTHLVSNWSTFTCLFLVVLTVIGVEVLGEVAIVISVGGKSTNMMEMIKEEF